MLEQNDEWAVRRRYMTQEIVTEVCKPEDIEPLPLAAEKHGDDNRRRQALGRLIHHGMGHYR